MTCSVDDTTRQRRARRIRSDSDETFGRRQNTQHRGGNIRGDGVRADHACRGNAINRMTGTRIKDVAVPPIVDDEATPR